MKRKLVPFLLTTTFTLLIGNAAFARRPPALAQQQDAVASVLAQCPEPETSGYRDMLARAEAPRPEPIATTTALSRPVAPRVAVARKRAGDLVVSCAGQEVHASGGYRDIHLRFQPEGLGPLMALRGRCD